MAVAGRSEPWRMAILFAVVHQEVFRKTRRRLVHLLLRLLVPGYGLFVPMERPSRRAPLNLKVT
jgi:hypothetical protein